MVAADHVSPSRTSTFCPSAYVGAAAGAGAPGAPGGGSAARAGPAAHAATHNTADATNPLDTSRWRAPARPAAPTFWIPMVVFPLTTAPFHWSAAGAST